MSDAVASPAYRRALCCPHCGAPTPASRWETTAPLPCDRCGERHATVVFPALFRAAPRGQTGDVVVDTSEASCFYHPTRRASVPCESCGRFLCRLCDLDVDGRHICPTCFEAGRQDEPEHPAAEPERAVLYDSIALTLALAPMIIFYFTLVTAPITLFMVVRYWNRVTVPTPRTRIRFVAAGVIALLQMAGWTALFLGLAGVF